MPLEDSPITANELSADNNHGLGVLDGAIVGGGLTESVDPYI